MKKYMCVSAMLVLMAVPVPGYAISFSDIKDAIVGHTRDIVGRFGDDKILAEADILGTGSFRSDDPGNDAAHNGKGKVSLVHKDGAFYLQFHPDFKSSFAPDPIVYVSSTARVFDNDSFNESEQNTHLGLLEKGSGASFVEIVGFDDPMDIKSVTIWCERFATFITSATLEFSDS